MPQRAPEGDVIYFDMDESTVIPEGTPEWISKKIFASPEYQADPKPNVPVGAAEESVPF